MVRPGLQLRMAGLQVVARSCSFGPYVTVAIREEALGTAAETTHVIIAAGLRMI